jgi:hypothetical protein
MHVSCGLPLGLDPCLPRLAGSGALGTGKPPALAAAPAQCRRDKVGGPREAIAALIREVARAVGVDAVRLVRVAQEGTTLGAVLGPELR